MAINNTTNSQSDLDKFSTGVSSVLDKLENPSLNNLYSTPGDMLRKRTALLRESVEGLNKPILKALANDMISVMVSWLDRPDVLCCIIQGIFSAYMVSHPELIEAGQIKKKFTIADSGFGKWLDNLIAFLDFIIILLTQDIKRWFIMIPDLIKEIYTAIMGAIILLIQETIFALRDSIIASIFTWMDTWDTDQTWSKCTPLKQLINVLKKYINDYGFLAKIMEKIKGYVSGIKGWGLKMQKDLVPNVKDLEFLYWLRDLLIRLKRAVLNFDLCIDYEFTAKPDDGTIAGVTGRPKTYIDALANANNDNIGPISDQLGYTTGADGSILIDKDKIIDGNWIPRLSNSFLREFIHKEYGIPYDVIDNTINRGSSADHIQGTIVTPNPFSKCANSPNAEQTLQWILNIKSRL